MLSNLLTLLIANICTQSMSMCICINCAYVDRCTAYHIIEEKHKQPHISLNPDFIPRSGSPKVNINIYTTNNKVESELDVVECSDYKEEKGRWKSMMPPGTLVKAGFDKEWIPS